MNRKIEFKSNWKSFSYDSTINKTLNNKLLNGNHTELKGNPTIATLKCLWESFMSVIWGLLENYGKLCWNGGRLCRVMIPWSP